MRFGRTTGRPATGLLVSAVVFLIAAAAIIHPVPAACAPQNPILRTVAFRTGPPDAIVVEGDSILGLSPGLNGSRTVSLPEGLHEFTLLADGYVCGTSTVYVASDGAVVEAKLERARSSLRLVAVAPTSGRPKSVEFTPDGRYLAVAALSGPGVDILDPATGRRILTLSPPEPYASYQGFVETAFPVGRDELWVTQMYSDSIHVFSLADWSYLRTIPSGGEFPKVLLAHPDGRVFVTHWLSSTVCSIDPATGLVLASIRTADTPRGMALSPGAATLFVAGFGSGTIDVLDAATLKRTTVLFDGKRGLPAGGTKRHLVVDPVRGRLYASDMERGSVFAVALDGYRLLAEIPVGQKNNTITLSPDGRWLYVSTRGPNNAVDYERKGPAFGEFLVIDTESLAVVERHWGGNQPTGLAVSPDGRLVVFTDFLDHRVEVYSCGNR